MFVVESLQRPKPLAKNLKVVKISKSLKALRLMKLLKAMLK